MSGEDDKQSATGAQQQIERLMKLKMEREQKEKMRIEAAGGQYEPRPEAIRQARVKPAGTAGARKKTSNTVIIEKRLYEKLHRVVSEVNSKGGPKITKAKFINLVLKEFLSLGIDYGVLKDREAVKKLFERLKTRS